MPDIAYDSAAPIVSRSRISPMKITSGAWRMAFFNAIRSSNASLRSHVD